ncbi:amino acid transporter [Apiospora saccharicola]|uniref:Amino acid transporter n=1 Tax=Apiospora saccharicola TaxID=335842 RepID=A0ABR1TI72_9PEZI
MLKITSLAALLLAAASSVSGDCTNPSVRKAWTALTDNEKKDFLQAEVCLMETPSKTRYAGSISRWDELQALHVAQVQYIHTTSNRTIGRNKVRQSNHNNFGQGSFLPWHRYFMTVHEAILRSDCGYKGVIPGSGRGPLYASSIFDAETGFGSNKTDAKGCLVDGPFANVTNTLLSNFTRTAPICLTRALDQSQFNLVAQAKVDLCDQSTNYVAGHFAVGGIMLDVALSPADALSFMHHNNLDRLWWQWQSKNLTSRLTDMGGINVATFSILADAQPKSLPASAFVPYFGDGGGAVTTLNHNLWMGDILPNITIAEVMDIHSDAICIEYL